MAIDAKISFLNQTEKRLAAILTAEQLPQVLSAVSDIMEGYEIRETAFAEENRDDLLDCYIDALQVQGRSERTLWRYKYVITRMLKTVGVPTRRITVYHLRNYLATLQKNGCKDSTAESERQVLSAYFNWLQREALIERNPTANLGAIKCAKRKKQIFSAVDMEKMKAACKCERDRAIIAFLAATGCRIGETTELNRDDIDFNSLECVVRGKGNKERTVYLNAVAAMQLKAYFASRTDDNPALFAGKGGTRLMPNGVRVMMRELEKRSGVDHIHPHKFRRTLATELSRHGMPIQEIAKILGHEKIDTTLKYVMINEDDIKQSYKRFA